jgi:hypothetical protein
VQLKKNATAYSVSTGAELPKVQATLGRALDLVFKMQDQKIAASSSYRTVDSVEVALGETPNCSLNAVEK